MRFDFAIEILFGLAFSNIFIFAQTNTQCIVEVCRFVFHGNPKTAMVYALSYAVQTIWYHPLSKSLHQIGATATPSSIWTLNSEGAKNYGTVNTTNFNMRFIVFTFLQREVSSSESIVEVFSKLELCHIILYYLVLLYNIRKTTDRLAFLVHYTTPKLPGRLFGFYSSNIVFHCQFYKNKTINLLNEVSGNF